MSKGRRLAELGALGLRVPRWFSVTADAGREEILATYRATFPGDGTVAVRSSAAYEDGAEHAFAGQLETVLPVSGKEALLEAVATVRGSAQSPRFAAYCRAHGLDVDRVDVTAIVQEYVDARVSGVLFTADPATRDETTVIVSAVRGPGGPLVSGAIEGETVRIPKKGPVPEASALSRRELEELRELAAAIERRYGTPQDVEWALDAAGIAILQTRPITGWKPPEPIVWDNSNIVESYPGITLPLTFSVAREAYAAVYRGAAELAGVSPASVAAHADVYERMIGLVRGRVYYNLNSWYSALALLPGFRHNRKFMEQMMGVGEPLEWNPKPLVREPRELARVVRMLLRAAWLTATLPGRVAAFERAVEAACVAHERTSLEGLPLDELLARYERLSAELHEQWRTPVVNDFATMVAHGSLRVLCERYGLPEAARHELLRSDAELASVAPARAVADLAATVRGDDDLAALFAGHSDAELVRLLLAEKRHPTFAADLRLYLERFGAHELRLEARTLRDDSAPLIGAIRRHLAVAQPPARPRAEDTPALLRFLAARTRNRIRDRESMRALRPRVFGVARELFRAAGRTLAQSRVLDADRDVFYLTIDELRALAAGTLTRPAAELVAERKVEFDAYRREPPPPERFTAGAPAEIPPPATDGRVLVGHGCAAGVVHGRARVVTSVEGSALEHGEILVAPQTDPGWIMLFPLAAAIVVERGSPLSHSAIVARELGIPTVVGVRGVIAAVPTGTELRVDGGRGTVEIAA
jgi:rifampicin phosphotransferase